MISILSFFILSILPQQFQNVLKLHMASKDTVTRADTKLPHYSTNTPISIDSTLSPIESMYLKINHGIPLMQMGYNSLRNMGNGSIPILLEIPKNYRIGTGDEIVIYMTGSIENILNLTVDRRGLIFIPGLGTVEVAGMSIDKIENILNNLAQKKWSNVHIEVTPGRIRGIKVYLTGEVERPGIYALKAHTTVLDLIFLAGGILKTGTLRKIKILHKDGSIREIDLYPFILGGKAKSLKLKDQDIVMVTTLKNVVAIDGCIHKRGIYEITGSTTLKDITTWAGLLPLNQERAEVRRIDKDSIIIFSVNRRNWNKTHLKSGDFIVIPFKQLNTSGYIFINGNVKKRGYYTYGKNISLNDVIKMAGGFLYPPYDEIIVFRRDTLTRKILNAHLQNIHKFKIQDGDSIIVYKKDVLSEKEKVMVNGYVTKPGIAEWYKNMSLKELLLSRGLRNDADINNVIVYRKSKAQNYTVSHEIWDTFLIWPGDIVLVTRDTMRNNLITVFVKGRVKYPGTYSIKKNMHINNVLKLAGGVTENAFKEGIYIKRALTTKPKKDAISNMSMLNLYLQANDTNTYIADDIKQTLLNRTANVIPGNSFDIKLMDKDTIVVPPVVPYIYVTGAVLKPFTIHYKDGLLIKDITENAPLFYSADKKHAFAIGINGEIHMRKLKYGDIVYIPFKAQRKSNVLKNLALIGTFVYQIAMTFFVIYQISK